MTAPIRSMPELLAVEVTSYTELIAVIEAGRIDMGYRQLDFEVLIGVTQGHWGKAAGLLQVKKFGIEKIFDALRGAGLRIRVEVDPDQRAKMLARAAEHFNPMQAKQARPGHSSTPASSHVLSRVFKPLARMGGKQRWAGKSKKQRSEHMRMMVMARIRKERKARKALQRRRQTIREKVRALQIHPSA